MERAQTVNLDLSGRVAVVTGASRRRGIGAAICRALAGHGADVLFTHWRAYDREQGSGEDADGPAALERELRALGVRAAGLEVDLSRPDAHRRVLDATAERLGPPTTWSTTPRTRRAAATRSWTPPRWTRTTRSTSARRPSSPPSSRAGIPAGRAGGSST